MGRLLERRLAPGKELTQGVSENHADLVPDLWGHLEQ